MILLLVRLMIWICIICIHSCSRSLYLGSFFFHFLEVLKTVGVTLVMNCIRSSPFLPLFVTATIMAIRVFKFPRKGYNRNIFSKKQHHYSNVIKVFCPWYCPALSNSAKTILRSHFCLLKVTALIFEHFIFKNDAQFLMTWLYAKNLPM